MRLWLALVLLGLLGGHLSDGCISAPVVERGEHRVLQADMHVHTRLSDGFLSPFEVALSAKRNGIDAIALTEHNMVWPGKMTRWFSELIGGPIVIVGEEVTSRRYHLLAFGIERTVAPRHDLRAVIADIHAQGGVAVAAHPTKRYWASFEPVLGDLDGIEVLHPAFYGTSKVFSSADMVAFYERARSQGKATTAIGSSDYHFYKVLGLGRTLLFVDEVSAEGVMEALRAGRTVIEMPDGRRFGHPELVARIDAEPMPAVDDGVGYAPAGALDLITRWLGWIGLLGLLLVDPSHKT